MEKRKFYTPFGWQGANYDRSLSVKEIAKRVRTFLKENYPDDKYSVTSTYNTLKVCLMESGTEAFNDGRTMGQVNHHWLMRNDRLTFNTKQKLSNIVDFINSYNYDDSDSMIDYFDTNFYLTIEVGTWNKPFKKKKR